MFTVRIFAINAGWRAKKQTFESRQASEILSSKICHKTHLYTEPQHRRGVWVHSTPRYIWSHSVLAFSVVFSSPASNGMRVLSLTFPSTVQLCPFEKRNMYQRRGRKQNKTNVPAYVTVLCVTGMNLDVNILSVSFCTGS